MGRFGENSAVVKGVIIWDGFTQPESKTGSDGTKFLQYDISIALPANGSDVADLQALLTEELNRGEFKGKFPNGGHWGIKPIEEGKFEGRLPGHVAIKAVSYQIKQVFNADRQEISDMQYRAQLYPGAVVELLVTPRTYNNVSKGLGFWLGGIRIVDPTAPRLPVGGVDASAAFGAVSAAPGVPGVGAPGVPGVGAPGVPGVGAPGVPGVGAPGVPGVGAPGAPGVPGVGYPAGGVQPAPSFLIPSAPGLPAPPPTPQAGPQMTAKAAGASYETFIAAGWTPEAMRAEGYLV